MNKQAAEFIGTFAGLAIGLTLVVIHLDGSKNRISFGTVVAEGDEAVTSEARADRGRRSAP
jgi:hypothetical protein